MTGKQRLTRKWETGTIAAVLAALMVAGAATGFSTSHPADAAAAAASSGAANLSAKADPAVPAGFSAMIERVAPAVVSVVVRENAEQTSARGAPDMPEGMQDFMERFFGEDWQKRFNAPQGAPQGEERRWKPMPQQPRIGAGSGFIVDPDGYVVTNNHVVQDASKVKVVLSDNAEYDAKVVGRDALTDLAVLKIEAGTALPYVAFSKDGSPKVGEWVVTVGNPFGLGNTVTAGIVSAHHRQIGQGPYDDFLQIDAAINKGNSGGPAFNTKGEVIGVNTAIFSPTGGSVGIGFAIPASTAQQIVAKLKSDGAVARGWLGVEIQPVNAGIAEGLGLDKPKGAIVAKVVPGGPADKAGVQQGDVILSVNGEGVTSVRTLPALVAAVEPDKKADFQILRNGTERALSVTLGDRTESQQVAAATDGGGEESALGLTLSGLDRSTRQRFDIPADAEGVVITGLDPDSEAAAKGLGVGDVIVQVSGEAVRSPADVERTVKAAKGSDRKTVLLLVRKDDQQRFVALPIRNA
jgi:serine protease Do